MKWSPPSFKIVSFWFTIHLKECRYISYWENFSEIETIILYKLWVKRILKPLGRGTILPYITLSKLPCLWLLLPNLSDTLIEKIQNFWFQFVWRKKQDRNSRKKWTKKTLKGVLGLPVIRCFMSVLKLGWIRRVINSKHKWKAVTGYINSKMGEIRRWSNLSSKLQYRKCFLEYFSCTKKNITAKVMHENA